MDKIERKAYAKVNLGLDVVRRLESGYHEVKMVMQSVSIFDTLILQKTEEGIVLTADTCEVPCDQHNLIYKAAVLMKETCSIKEGVAIHLMKRIPVAAGMAGGSTDAAAVLCGMNELFSLNRPIEELMALGKNLGADVPYCIMGKTALACGIGEKLTKLPDMPDCFFLVAKPEISISTKYVYENLHVETLKKHPDIDGMVEAIHENNLSGIVERMENVLETVTEKENDIIKKLKAFMEENGARKAMMSGSGPTVFGVYEKENEAQKAKDILSGLGLAKDIFVAKPCLGEE